MSEATLRDLLAYFVDRDSEQQHPMVVKARAALASVFSRNRPTERHFATADDFFFPLPVRTFKNKSHTMPVKWWVHRKARLAMQRASRRRNRA